MSSLCRQASGCTASALPAGKAPATCRGGLLSAVLAHATTDLEDRVQCAVLWQGHLLLLQTC